MNIAVSYPWILVLLPLVLAPVVLRHPRPLAHPALDLIPRDRASDLMGLGLRVVGGLAIAALVVALSQPYRPAETVPRIGQGGQIVLLLDRSRSMDEPFYSPERPRVPLLAMPRGESKGAVARRLLGEFAARRHDDLFAMVAFSNHPIVILPFTQKQALVQAAIEAGDIGKGLAETDVGVGLIQAVRLFEDRPYNGSRIILLVSDGATHMDPLTRAHIRAQLKRARVVLYWIYIRTRNSPGLFEDDSGAVRDPAPPQRALHEFFLSSGVPYRVYTAEDPDALRRAIADVGRLQTLPIRYLDVIARRDLSDGLYWAALGLLGVLLAARALEIRAWR
jgi:mxaC protein